MKISMMIFFLSGVSLFFSEQTLADRNQYCEGFSEGYKAIKGDTAAAPWCPPMPPIPPGGTAYREGIRAGIKMAAR